MGNFKHTTSVYSSLTNVIITIQYYSLPQIMTKRDLEGVTFFFFCVCISNYDRITII